MVKGCDGMLMFKMIDLKKIANETKNKSFLGISEFKKAPDVSKYDRVYITNQKSKKLLDLNK